MNCPGRALSPSNRRTGRWALILRWLGKKASLDSLQSGDGFWWPCRQLSGTLVRTLILLSTLVEWLPGFETGRPGQIWTSGNPSTYPKTRGAWVINEKTLMFVHYTIYTFKLFISRSYKIILLDVILPTYMYYNGGMVTEEPSFFFIKTKKKLKINKYINYLWRVNKTEAFELNCIELMRDSSHNV